MADTLTKIVEIELDASKALNELIQYNKAIEASTALEKQAQEEYGKTSKEYEVQRQKTQALKKEKQTLQREVQNEIKMETKAKDSLNAMRAELSNLTKQYDNLSKAERENTDVGGKLQKQIVEQTKAIKAAEYETERYYRNVGNYTNSILDAIGMNNQLGQALLVNGGNFKTMAAVVGNSVKSMNTALMSLMNNPVFIAIAGIVGVGVAFKFWADYNEGIAKATRLTKEFTGLAGQQLTELRSSIMATSEVMDKDYNDVLKTADSLMAHFHLTGAEAMEVINKGFAAGADLNGDMLNLLQQNAGAFHDAGISASEMMAIITQTRSGIFSTEGLNIIKQGSIRIREMSAETSKALNAIGINAEEMQRKLTDGTMSTFDGLKQISAKLKELPDNASATGEAIKDVFGKTGRAASQEMIESLATMSTSLDEVLSQTGDYGKLLLEQINTQADVEKSAAKLFAVENGGWEAVKMKCEIYWNTALNGLLSYWNMGKKFWKYVIQGVGNFVIKINGGIQAMFTMFGFAFQQVKKLGSAFTTLGDIIGNAITGDFGKASDAFGRLKDLVASVGSDYHAAIASAKGKYSGSVSTNTGALDDWLWGEGDYTKPVASGGASSGGGGSTSTGGTTKGGKSGGGKGGTTNEKAAQALAEGSIAAIKQQISILTKMRDSIGAEDIGKTRELTAEINALQWQLTNLNNYMNEHGLFDQFKVDDITSRLTAINHNLIQSLQAPKVELAKVDDQLAQVGNTANIVADIMGNLGNVLDGNAGDWLKWGANLISTIARTLPQLQALVSAQTSAAGASAMAQNAGTSPWGWIQGIAAIAAIIAAVAKLPKFATGGYISGAGTATSDSIPARLSNGESVINANSTAMFGSLLSSLNQFGGGAPIQANASAQSVQGEEMLARAFQRGAASLPAPVVGVREFTKVSNQVVTIKDTAKL